MSVTILRAVASELMALAIVSSGCNHDRHPELPKASRDYDSARVVLFDKPSKTALNRWR